MAAAAPHAKLIDAAARRHLKPLGCTQKGRSRTWLLDRVWFASVVEFQPSAYSKGSFLNVGAHFLWTWNDHVSFDFGYRLENFEPFETEAQFARSAEHLAVRAAEELGKLDAKFPGVGAVALAFPDSSDRSPWPRYHRAISLGLTGNWPEAKRLFEGIASGSKATDWERELAARCDQFVHVVSNHSTFSSSVAALVTEHRSSLGLSAHTISIEQAQFT